MDKAPELEIGDNGDGPMIGFEFEGIFIVDPRMSECGRFEVDPAGYGLTEEQADEIIAINNEIRASLNPEKVAREFIEIFGGAGAQFLEFDGEGPLARVKKARIFEFSIVPRTQRVAPAKLPPGLREPGCRGR